MWYHITGTWLSQIERNILKTKTNPEEKNQLRKGEQRRSNGTYGYQWTDDNGKRHIIYAKTLAELRIREDELLRDLADDIKAESRNKTINDMYECWKDLKRGLKDNTFQNYQYLYQMYVAPGFGKTRISELVKSDVKRFYNTLVDVRGLAINTVDGVHTVLRQVLDMAVDDNYIRRNPADNVLKELKSAHAFGIEKRKALTQAEEQLFLDYLKQSPQYRHWYPIFAVMLGTGLRVGEAVGLRWCDIDFSDGMIDVNHTLVYYKHAVNGCYFNVHTPKTKAGIRRIPMLGNVKEAFLEERRNQVASGVRCSIKVDGYTDFIFVNRFGHTQHQGTLNKAIRRIIRDCNDHVLDSCKPNLILLPPFSCHTLRHTFATRMCEKGVNIKVIQDILGHADVSTTLNIYTDATKDLKKREFELLDAQINARNK